MFFMDKAYYFSRCHGIGVSYWISAFSSSLHFFPRPPGLWRTLCRWICLSILSVQSIKGQTTQGQAKQGRSLPLRAGPHRVRLHKYTGPSIQSIKDGPASIRHQGPSIQIIRATNHQSIKSSRHQASGAFYAKHQGWTHKLTPCASKHQGPSIPFIKASNHQSIKHQGPSIQNIKGGPANWHLVLSGSLT